MNKEFKESEIVKETNLLDKIYFKYAVNISDNKILFLNDFHQAVLDYKKQWIEQQLEERENEVWDEVIKTCAQAWDGNHIYDNSPIELIVDLINERDKARQQLSQAKIDELDYQINTSPEDEQHSIKRMQQRVEELKDE